MAREVVLVKARGNNLCVYCCRPTPWIEPFTKVAACNVEHLAKATGQTDRQPELVGSGRKQR